MKIIVDYDTKTRKLTMDVPFALVGIVRLLPVRKYNNVTRRWVAPILLGNLRMLELHKAHFSYMPKARAAIDESRSMGTGVKDYFPIHYKFHTEPRDYQYAALQRAYPRHAFALFMDVRTGKTKVAIDLTCARAMQGEVTHMLICAPKSVREVWLEEFEKHAPRGFDPFVVGTVSNKARERALYDNWMTRSRGGIKVLLVSTEGLSSSAYQLKLCKLFLKATKKAQFVLDESSMCKDHKAKRTKHIIEIAALAAFRLILTGTPIDKGIQDKFAQFQILDPEIIGMGDYYAFRSRYCVMGGYMTKEIVGNQNLDEFLELIKPWSHLVPQDVLGLPERTHVVRWVDPSEEQRALFRTIQSPCLNNPTVQNALEAMLRLQQIVGGNNPVRALPDAPVVLTPLDKNPKLNELLAVIEELPDAKIMVWARYVDEIQMIAERLRQAGHNVVEFWGGIAEDVRKVARKRFQEDPDTRIFVGNQQTGGKGIPLYAGMDDAHVSIYFSNTFSYIDRRQSEDRSIAKGQSKGLLVIDLAMRESVDIDIIQAHKDKKNINDYVREALNRGTPLHIEPPLQLA